MNLEFAIEAAKRKCPYVSLSSPSEVKFHYGPAEESSSFSYVREKCSAYRKFIIGATLALWWDEHLQETKIEKDYPLCNRYAADARLFARGFKR
jgi:hypothetical protein